MTPALLLQTSDCRRVSIVSLLLLSGSLHAGDPSTCYGTTANGSLENGWELPSRGANFTAYSGMARLLGRTYVHSEVHSLVVAAYAELEESAPGKVFVYGETGFEDGGQFKPHKTHRNGLSVDFMVPVLDRDGNSVPLPTGIFDKWGYDLEFDSSGNFGDLSIDADALAEHIYQLHKAAQMQGIAIWRVVFDPQLQPLLHESERWPYLKENVQFSTKRSWVRHDEHYHVDFDVPCELATAPGGP